jgi:hypothetical protein
MDAAKAITSNPKGRYPYSPLSDAEDSLRPKWPTYRSDQQTRAGWATPADLIHAASSPGFDRHLHSSAGRISGRRGVVARRWLATLPNVRTAAAGSATAAHRGCGPPGRRGPAARGGRRRGQAVTVCAAGSKGYAHVSGSACPPPGSHPRWEAQGGGAGPVAPHPLPLP